MPAPAFDTLTAGELEAAFASGTALARSSVAERCIFYTHGFLDGAPATDPRVATNVERVLAKEESFSDRAFRTRLGPRMDCFGASVFADFGVPLTRDLTEVVDEIVQAMDMAEPARDLVYRALRTHYPCPDTD